MRYPRRQHPAAATVVLTSSASSPTSALFLSALHAGAGQRQQHQRSRALRSGRPFCSAAASAFQHSQKRSWAAARACFLGSSDFGMIACTPRLPSTWRVGGEGSTGEMSAEEPCKAGRQALPGRRHGAERLRESWQAQSSCCACRACSACCAVLCCARRTS